tara:strand:- start:413 stop:901 length:489 start_codon:yes stop_codon:yes gene_type:complete
MKWTEISFPFIFVWIIQILFVDLLSIGTVRPDFPLILILYLSVKHGRFTGVLSGFIFGLLIDLSGSAMFFGLSSLTYTTSGYIFGNLKGVYNKVSPILFTTSWVLVVFFHFFIFCLVQYQELWVINNSLFWSKWFGTSIYTLSFLILFQFLFPLNKKSNVKS